MITCKEDLIGTVIRVNNREDAELVTNVCKSIGIDIATWEETKYTKLSVAAKISHDLGTRHSCKLIFSDSFKERKTTADEFRNLTEIPISELKIRTKESTAVETLERMGYEWKGGELWKSPLGKKPGYLQDAIDKALLGSFASGGLVTPPKTYIASESGYSYDKPIIKFQVTGEKEAYQKAIDIAFSNFKDDRFTHSKPDLHEDSEYSLIGKLNDIRTAFASTKELIEENRIVAHPNDYIKLAECGAVCRLTRSGIKIIMSELASEGKIITTGALAEALMKEEGNCEQ